MIKKAVVDYLVNDSTIKSLLGQDPTALFFNSDKFEDTRVPQVIYYTTSPQMQDKEEELYFQDFTFEVYASDGIEGVKIIARLIELMNIFSKANLVISSGDDRLTVRSVWIQSSFSESTFRKNEKIKYTNSVAFRVVYSWKMSS